MTEPQQTDIVSEARELAARIEPERKTAFCKAVTHTASLFMAQQMIRRLADEVEAQRNAVDRLIADQVERNKP